MKDKTITPSDILSDALFRSADLEFVIVVGMNKDGDVTVWRSTDSNMHAVGLLEAAKLQTLGLVGEDDVDEYESENEEEEKV